MNAPNVRTVRDDVRAHETLVRALANNADPAVPEDIVGGALELAIGEAEALAEHYETKDPRGLLAYALAGRLKALSSFICFSCKLEFKDAAAEGGVS